MSANALASLFGPQGCGYIGVVEDDLDRPLRWVEPIHFIAGPDHWRERAAKKRAKWSRETAGPRPSYVHWTEQDDAILCDAISNGKTFASAGKILNRTKNSCIGRFRRISAKMEA